MHSLMLKLGCLTCKLSDMQAVCVFADFEKDGSFACHMVFHLEQRVQLRAADLEGSHYDR